MTFLAPAWLLLAALTGVVFLLHARRRRRVDFPSVHIWRLIEHSTNRRRRLQRPPVSLPMLLQLLVIVAIAFALAQPRFGAAGEPEHVVFLLDSSGSMRAEDGTAERFAVARDALSDALAEFDGTGNARASVVTVGPRPRLEIARQTDADGMLPIVKALRASDGAADWNAVAPLLEPILRTGETLRIAILSDDAEGAAAIIGAALPDVEIAAMAVGAAMPNLALSAAVAADEDGEWTVSGEVRFIDTAPEATEIAVLFRRQGDDRFLDFGTITVAPEDEDGAALAEATSNALPFEAPLQLPGPGSLRLSLPDDAGPHDNQVHFVLADQLRRAQILIVGAGDAYLNRALTAVDDVDVFRSDALPDDVSAFDLVIVDDVAVERRPETNVLWLERGRVAGAPEPAVLADAYFVDWDGAHPLSANVDWANLAAPRGFDIALLGGGDAIVEAAGGPLVQARTTPYGREIVVALAAFASGWVEEPGYPAFIANVIDWLDIDLGAASPEPCRVGSACVVEAKLLGQPLIAPDGSALPLGRSDAAAWLLPGADRAFVPLRAGFYRVGSGAEATAIAVNASAPTESDLTVVTGSASLPGHNAGGEAIWRWLLLVALGLLIAETWIAGRGSERFLKRHALARSVPFAVQRRWHLGLRIAAIATVLAGLVALPAPTREPAGEVVAVVAADLDSGVAEPRREAVVSAITTTDGTDAGRVGLVVAGEPTRIAVDPGGANGSAGAPLPGADLEEAIAVDAAMLRGDRPGRIVVTADGNQSAGALADVVGQLGARDIPVDVYPTETLPAGEVLVERVEVPPTILAGDSFTLNAILFSESATDATVTLLRDGEIVSEQTVSLAAGSNRIEAPISAFEPGERLYEVVVAAASDVVAANNRTGVVATIDAAPKTLIVAGNAEWGAFFADALAVQGLTAEVAAPDRAPFYIDGWLEYDLVVLMNVPAIDLSTLQQELIADYVETHGRGLLILGGEHAFGPGGYYQTDLERISPLSARVPQDAPGAAMMFVLDRSGSMQASVEDVNRLDIAKEATLNAIGLLHEESQVGVIVDEEPHPIVPMQERKDEAAIEAALRPVEPGGGTKLYPALAAAIDALADTDAQAKHIVVMTDGLIEPVEFVPLLGRAREAGVTISTVAIGGGADVMRAEEIARFGGGASHATQDFRALPSILSQEAMMLSGTPVEIGTAPVFWVDRSAAFLAGLPDELPPLENYVRTTLRPNATLHLATLNEDDETMPIMASWRYGNGRVLALATHGAGSGTQNWLQLPQYPLMWAQIARHFASDSDAPGLDASATLRGDATLIEVTALDPDGEALAGQDIVASPVGGDGQPIALSETAPGRYAAMIDDSTVGTRRYEIAAGEETTTVALHVGYAAAYDFTRADPADLAAFAGATGGTVLVADPLAGAGADDWVLARDWRPWALLALVLFLADLVVRYAPGLIRLPRRNAFGNAGAGAPA